MATAAVALVAVDIVVPLVVRSESINSKDVTLAAANARAKQGLTINDQSPATLNDDSGLKGEVGWSFVTLGGVSRVLLAPASDEQANPDMSSGAWLDEPSHRRQRVQHRPAIPGAGILRDHLQPTARLPGRMDSHERPGRDSCAGWCWPSC